MLSTNQCLFAIIALLAVIASGAVLENLDSNNQRHLPQPLAIPPLHENLRYAGKKRSSPLLHLFFPRAFTDDNDDTNPNDPAGNRISTTDPDVVTPSNGNEETTDPSDGNPDDTNDANNESVYTLSGSYTADTSFTTPIATGTVHTGGIGGGTSTGETTTTATTTTGVLGPNTTGSVPSGGNVVPSETASASAGTSVTATATGGTGTQTGTGASATSSQGAAAGNAVNVGGLLGLVGVGIGWLL